MYWLSPIGIFKIQDGVQHVVRAMNEVSGKCRFSGSDSSETETLWRIYKGQSGVNLKDTVRLADHENPQFGANSVHVSLKVAELQFLEDAIGLSAIFQIFGEK